MLATIGLVLLFGVGAALFARRTRLLVRLVGLGRPTATTTDAAHAVLTGRAETLTAHQLHAGMRRVLGRLVDLKSLDGLLELAWHTDQLHRVGAGLKPDLNRGRIATTLAMLRRNGTTSFGRKRGL